jgi:hypothetical protein
MICLPFNEYDKLQFCKIMGDLAITPHFRGIKGTKDGVVVCGAGFDRWTKNSCETHLWIRSPKDLTKHFIREVFKYLFVTCDLGLVIGITPCNNTAAIEFNRKLGWKEVCRIKDGYALGTETAIQVMRREECRWINQDVKWINQAVPQPQITRH